MIWAFCWHNFADDFTGHTDLPLGMVDVDRLMADIVVATYNEVGTLLAQFCYVLEECIKEIHLKFLPHITCSARWYVHTHNGHIAIVSTKHTPFTVVAVVMHANNHAVRLLFREDGNTAVTLLLSRVNIDVLVA